MKKILLINPSWNVMDGNLWKDVASVYPALGLGYIASVLEEDGHEVEIVDYNIEPLYESKLWSDYDFVGITATTPLINEALKIADIIKKGRPETQIILGGVHPSIMPEEVLDDPNVKYVIRGEGEMTFKELVNGKTPIKDILGLSWKDMDHDFVIVTHHNPNRPLIKDLDTIPMPAYHLLKIDRYKPAIGSYKRLPAINMYTSRGCIGSCTYCYRTFGKICRFRSAFKIVNEIKYLQEKFKIKEINLYDDSISEDQQIIFKQGNKILVKPIKYLFDYCNATPHKQADIIIKKPNIQVPCVNDSYKIVWKQPNKIIKHKTNKKLYDIKLINGRKITVTGDHSVFKYECGKLFETPVKKLKIGDFIVIIKNIPTSINHISSFNIIKILKDNFKDNCRSIICGDDIDKLMLQHSNLSHYEKKRNYISLRNFNTNINLQKYNIKISSNNSTINPILNHINSDFYWMLGALMGDGSFSQDFSKRNCITMTKKKLNSKVDKIMLKYFGIKSKTQKYTSTHSEGIYWNNKPLLLFFKYLGCSSPASTKEIPSIMFSETKKNIRAFLKGLWDSDGSTETYGYNIVTSSTQMASQICYLLSILGLHYSVWKKHHKQFFVYHIRTPNKMWSCNSHFYAHRQGMPIKTYTTDNLLKKLPAHTRCFINKNRGNLTIPALKNIILNDIDTKFINSDISLDKIKSITQQKPKIQEVYDISVPKFHNFITGFAPILAHNTFNIHKKNVQDFCNILIKENIDITWSCFGRVDFTDYETLKLMKMSGCWLMLFGVESSNEQIRKNIKKNITLNQVEQSVRWCKELGIETRCSFMVGNPGETVQTMQDSIDYAIRLDPDTVQFNIATPYPGTKFHEWCVDNGYMKDLSYDNYTVSEVLFNHPDITEEELKRYCKMAHRKFYLRPKIILRRLFKIRSFAQLKQEMQGAMAVIGVGR